MTRTRLLTGLALGPLLLTGCGASGWNPGVAAQVGDETIAMSEADDVTASYCDALVQNPQNDQVVANRYVRGRVISNLVLRSAAEQFAEDQGVVADGSYAATVAQAEQSGSFDGLSEAEKEAVIDVDGAAYYVDAVQQSVGEDGAELFAQWLDEHAPELDPRFGLAIEDGQPVSADTGVSVAVSEVAEQGRAEEPDTAYAAGLPSSQRCG